MSALVRADARRVRRYGVALVVPLALLLAESVDTATGSDAMASGDASAAPRSVNGGGAGGGRLTGAAPGAASFDVRSVMQAIRRQR